MSMNEFLSQYYGTVETTKEASEEDLEKQAQVEIFAKLAADNGIDLNSLNDDQLTELYNHTFSKEASETEESTETAADAVDETAKLAEAAEVEFLEKKAAAEKIAEADFLGRQMAHAYVDELKKIAAAAEQEKAAEFPPKKDDDDKDEKKDEKSESKSDDKSDDKGGKKLPPWLMDKKAAALDLFAAQSAFAMIQDFNKTASEKMDEKVAQDRIGAVLTLGLPDSVKVASAADMNGAVTVRALELLEYAGYPVEWAQ